MISAPIPVQRAALDASKNNTARQMAELAIDRRPPDTALLTPAEPPPQQRYINRELSWLAFNERVLDEAANPAHPLLERVRFLSISDSNLDEFYMVRVAGLKELAAGNIPVRSDDGLSAEQQLAAIAEVTGSLVHRQQRCWAELQQRLAEERISILGHDALTAADRAWLRAALCRPAAAGVDADRDRPGASLPVCAEPRAGHGRRAAARRRLPGQRAGHDPRADRPVPQAAGRGDPVYLGRGGDCRGRAGRAVSRHGPDRPRHVPGAARQRHRDRGGSPRPRADVRIGAEAAAPGPDHPPDVLLRHPRSAARLRQRRDRRRCRRRGGARRHGRPVGLPSADHLGAARSVVPAVYAALSRTHPRFRRGLLCRDPGQGHPRPSPV